MARALVALAFLVSGCTGALGVTAQPGAGRDGGPDLDLGDDVDEGGDPPIPPDGQDGGPIVPPDDEPGDACGDIRTANAVYYGTAQPTVVSLAPGQLLAIGTFGGCSGTVIAPTWVLTATHCGLSGGEELCVGQDAPDTCLGSLRAYDNPDGDMTLLELDRDAREVLPGLVPIPILTDDMDDGWIGRTAEASGYGQQEDGSSGEREFTAEPIASLSGDTLTIDGEGRHGVCFGDSGGPVMVVASDGTGRVAGDLSNGDGSCVGQDNYTRVDVHRAWIESHTGPTAPADGCGGIDAAGRCLDGVASWCDANDELQSERCAGGEACGWDAAARGFRCIAGADPCGGVDAAGACDGATARWCDHGALRTRDCAACGQSCDPQSPLGGAYCVDDPCAGLDYLGRCDGDVAVWCEDGGLQSEDCAAMGRSCRWIDDQTGYYCG